MTIQDIYRGEDVSLQLTVKYDDGTAVDLTQVNGYKVEVFQDGKIIQKFSKNAAAGYTLTTDVTPASGIFKVNILGTNTVDANCDKPVYYNIKIEFDDTSFPSLVALKDSGNIQFATMRESKQRSQTTFV